ncbi:MAG: NUDIX domain-containing protein [Chloroflexota bacterium]|nr:NUDIX domain-containing protein [Chloroflexota bacterium]
MTRIANFCPTCGNALARQRHSGRERPYCLNCAAPIYFDPKVAVVVFLERNDEVLLIRRAVDPGKGKWALPAGFVDYDEAPEDAAARETLEETSLQVRIDKLLEVFPRKDDGLADIVIAYSASILSGEARAGDDADEVGWFSRDSLPTLVFYPSITLTARWRVGQLDT